MNLPLRCTAAGSSPGFGLVTAMVLGIALISSCSSDPNDPSGTNPANAGSSVAGAAGNGASGVGSIGASIAGAAGNPASGVASAGAASTPTGAAGTGGVGETAWKTLSLSEMCVDKAPSSSPPDLNGVWAVRTISSRLISTSGIVATEYYQSTVSVLLASQTEVGQNVQLSAQFCDQRSEDDGPFAHVTVPASYVAALKPFVRNGTYQANDNGTKVLFLPRFPQVIGANLADPLSDPMPIGPTEPTVVDQDQDGHPGATLKVSGVAQGDIYVAQRQVDELSGVAVSDDRIIGLYAFTSEQNILASDPEGIKKLATMTATTDARPCVSTFVMVRLPGNSTCADVLANTKLFD